MIYTFLDLICLDRFILLLFPNFCLSEYINNCKSPVDIVTKSNLGSYSNKVSSPHLPDRKKTLPFELTPETTFVEV